MLTKLPPVAPLFPTLHNARDSLDIALTASCVLYNLSVKIHRHYQVELGEEWAKALNEAIENYRKAFYGD